MALVLADRVRDTTTTTGTGTVTLSGTAPTGYQTFGAAIGNGNTTYYTINAGSQWEVGLGTYSSTGPTLARTTVLASSNGGSLVDFSTGTKDVFVTYPAEESVYQDGSAIKAGTAILGVANGGTGVTSLTSGYLVKGNGTSAVSASVVYDDGTNVGIGTSSPSSFSGYTSLTVSNATNGGLVEATNGTRTIRMQSQASGSALIGTTTSHNLGIMSAGVERITVDTSGNASIGTTAGLARLRVAAAGAVNAPVLGNVTNYPAFLSNNDPSYGLGIGTSAGDGRVWLQAQRSDSATAYNLTLNEAGGNVGIGTSSPSSKLDVSSLVTLSGGESSQLRWLISGKDWRANASPGGNWYLYDATNNKFPFTIQGNAPSDAFYMTSSGNVGIGNSGPGYRLDVSAADTTAGLGYGMRLRANASANGGSMQFTDSGVTSQWGIITANSSEFRLTADGRPLTFYTGGAERARIDSSGRVLVGSTSTSYAYADSSMRWNASDGGLLLSQNSTANVNQVVFFNPNGAVGSINSDGSGTIYATSSDYRLKNIDGPLKNSGAYIDALKPVQGSWKADGSRFIGFLAHQVQEVSQTPVVVGEKDGEKMQAMDYSAPEIITNLIAEVQSLRARVAQLEGN